VLFRDCLSPSLSDYFRAVLDDERLPFFSVSAAVDESGSTPTPLAGSTFTLVSLSDCWLDAVVTVVLLIRVIDIGNAVSSSAVGEALRVVDSSCDLSVSFDARGPLFPDQGSSHRYGSSPVLSSGAVSIVALLGAVPFVIMKPFSLRTALCLFVVAFSVAVFAGQLTELVLADLFELFVL
jgi:hypothetical protein